MSHAIRIHQLGAPDVLHFDTLVGNDPGPGSVRIRHTAIGVNYIDTYHRRGIYPLPSLPHGLGMEAVGVVVGVGEGVRSVSVGDRVGYACGPPGAYAEERVLPAETLVPLPDTVDDATAAACLLKGMTVEYLIYRCAPVKPGMTILWHAAAGGVGLIACQWLAHLGVEVIGTVSTDDKAQLARANGCAHTIVYTEEDFPERVRDITHGAGVPIVFDSVGHSTFDGSLECLSPRGMLVGFGNASGTAPPIDPLRLSAGGSLFLTRPKLFDYTATRAELLGSAAAIFEAVGCGVVHATPRHRWPLREAAEAHRVLEARSTTGGIVLEP